MVAAKKPKPISVDQYREMEDAMEGLCLACGALRECTEPDAEGYPCDECDESAVVGCDVLLWEGMVRE